jgi:hypothetical protein
MAILSGHVEVSEGSVGQGHGCTRPVPERINAARCLRILDEPRSIGPVG